ncbi:MAG: hypothetical protein KIS69_11475 [Bacteroidetes bacterium]|nr:hypothetical protein [Bacteroidota bacterium]
MKQTFLYNKRHYLTAQHESQRWEVLFIAYPHFLCFNFIAASQVAHFGLPLSHKPPQRQNKKSHFPQRFFSGTTTLIPILETKIFHSKYAKNHF